MFSPIYSSDIKKIITTTTDEDPVPTEIPKPLEDVCVSTFKDNINNSNDSNSTSLLAVLDDKNRVISNLKKQLQNQKMQLTYYIGKELRRSKIENLAESCTPQASEESLPLNLALNKFCKQTGIKTKLLQLHERMSHFDYKISNALKDQEFLLRRIVNKLCEFMKRQELSQDDFRKQFGNLLVDPMSINLFNSLISATTTLGRQLDGFKICCDRVLIIEEERNNIVEQVYSLPVEDRINCNFLLEIQMEKAQLENEIKRISLHQETGRHRIKELNVIEKILHNLQWELNSSFLKNEESCISKMLEKINSEAKVLLQMTKEQRQKFECELSKTKCPEPNRVLLFINMAAANDKFERKDFDRCGITTEEEIGFFEMVKKEVDLIKLKLKEECEKAIKKVKDDYNSLRGKMSQVLLDNSKNKMANKSLTIELDELRFNQKNETHRLKQELDAYKSQVEDLQAIREAYAQLVDKQPNMTQMEREFRQQITERDNKILDLERLTAAQTNMIEDLQIKLDEQTDQIAILNRFISLSKPNALKQHKKPTQFPNCSSEPCPSYSRIKLDPYSKSDVYCYHLHKNTPARNICKKSDILFAKSRPLASQNCIINETPCKRKLSKNNSSFQLLSERESLSCYNLISLQPPTSKDIVKGMMIKNDEIKRKVKLERSSLFSLEIKYQNSDIDSDLFEIDEYEMFKDLSSDSMVLENEYRRNARSF